MPTSKRSEAKLIALWEEHLRHEFQTKSTADTLDTMVPNAYVNHVPTLTGGRGRDRLGDFYATHFIPKMPADASLVPISRTVGESRLVDEFIFGFTHDIQMDWMLAGVPPTGKRVEVPFVVIVQFEGDKLAHEHIYWDQATVLAQLGLLNAKGLPVSGIEQAVKLRNPSLPSNELIRVST
ncbi:MAG: ester cyclase [SAR202 cluster bacterium]|nr:ester cyclase [SAR202 cluster bacterium]